MSKKVEEPQGGHVDPSLPEHIKNFVLAGQEHTRKQLAEQEVAAQESLVRLDEKVAAAEEAWAKLEAETKIVFDEAKKLGFSDKASTAISGYVPDRKLLAEG